MQIRHAFTAAGAAIVLTAAAAAGTVAAAQPSGHHHGFRPPANSLRSLAAEIGLRVGTAVTPFELDRPDYRRITAEQFSSVTPGNEMKWEVVEPTRGTYDWSAADRLQRLPGRPGQAGRGPTPPPDTQPPRGRGRGGP